VITIDNEKRLNWHQIRAEYIAGASQRSLAEKYSINRAAIERRSRLEDWTGERIKAKAKVQEKIIQKTAEKVADNATLAADIQRTGLEILARLFSDYKQISATEHRDYQGRNLTDIKRLRDLTAAYKDLTEGIETGASNKNAPVYELLRKLDGECDV
jgi:hypothetical protein